ncbi:MAG TPA: hypothetical protein VG842_05790, partial [Sediminibacterium sp.]|nr:hypothetical protein [Sediminibacterium sp.]
FRNNHYNSNLYTLVEYFLLLWLFYRIRQHGKSGSIAAAVVGLIIWIADNIWLHAIENSNILFRLSSSLVILWLSINQLTSFVLSSLDNNFKATGLLICAAFCVYYAYRSFVLFFKFFFSEACSAYEPKLWLVINLINIGTNITLLIAMLCLPKTSHSIPAF